LDSSDISVNNEENIDEVMSLKQNLDNLVQNFQHFPVQNVYEHQELGPQMYDNFQVENIYDKNTIEQILDDINYKNAAAENAITFDNSENEIIESEQLEDILLANYLVSSQHTNEPISLVKETNFIPDSKNFNINQNTDNIKQKKNKTKEETIQETPLNAPRAERQIMIPEAVSNFFTSISSSISYFDGSDPPPASKGRAFGGTGLYSQNSIKENSLNTNINIEKEGSKKNVESFKSKDKTIMIPFNKTVYIPIEAEQVETFDTPKKNNQEMGRANDYQYMKYMTPPKFTTLALAESSSEKPHDLDDLIAVESEIEDKQAPEEKNHNKAFSIWPKSAINTTFQDTWIGMHMSPVEVERQKRQLELEMKKSEHILSVQQRQKRQTMEPTDIIESEENQRNRRQTTDPDQLCPTVASFVMPRAGVNAKGDWMFIVNMPEETQYRQLVRSEICISDNCRGLCGVPPGLTTKCSQQFVQKKLIALDPSGDKLVEDVFWFPSCCVCQITQE